METKTSLHRKTTISWLYFVLAICLVIITFIPKNPLFYVQPHGIYGGYLNFYYENSLSGYSVGLWVGAILYFSHFMNMIYRSADYSESDRIVLITIAVVIVGICIYFGLHDNDYANKFNNAFWGRNAWIFTLVWLLLNLTLVIAAQPPNRFKLVAEK